MTIPPIEVSFGAATDPGLKRALNEDALLAVAPIFLVADGMGGYDAGEVASSTVVDEFSSLAGRPSLDMEDVKAAFTRARSRVDALPAEEGSGPGTTLTGVAIAEHGGGGYWLVFNVGDSRTYRLANGNLEQISVDHSVVQELIEDGSLSEAAARVDRRRNVVTRAIGAGDKGAPDYWLLPAVTGDRLLVCSDGLTGELTDEQIQAVLLDESSPQAAANRLVHEARLLGARDNVTAVVVDAIAVHLAPDEAVGTDDDTVPRKGREEV